MDFPSRGRAGRGSETWHKISVCVVEDGETSFGKKNRGSFTLQTGEKAELKISHSEASST